jgi:lipoprotein-anchoring transpeptidase ErfK/SrfK
MSAANVNLFRSARAAALGGIFCLVLSVSAFSQSPSATVGGALSTATDGRGSASANDDELAPALRRQIVSYPTEQPPGTVVVDTAHTFLYLTLGGGEALRYGIGVGRKGFTWSGVEKISRKSEWPDWIPPAEMIARQPYLPRWVGGGPGNPLGARALYLGNSDYRIHGTNNPASIGKHVSSGCIRMRDADVIDLYNRVGVGTKVVVLASDQPMVALDEHPDVTVPHNATGVMTARISVAPTPASDEPARRRVEWDRSPATLGLY